MYLPLNPQERDALRELAEAEDRDPRYQAARFVREGLIRAGKLDTVPPHDQGERHADPAR